MLQREFSVSPMVGWYRTREFYLPSRRVDLSGSRGRDTARRPTSPCFGAFSLPPTLFVLSCRLGLALVLQAQAASRIPLHTFTGSPAVLALLGTDRGISPLLSVSAVHLLLGCMRQSDQLTLAGILAESVSLRFSSIVTVIRYP